MSGAKNCPETPRQKMIGMMYLVLTAMLALNVSTEVLQGFAMVDDSLRSSIESSDIRMRTVSAEFRSLYDLNPAKVKEWLDKATEVKKQSDSIYTYIQDFKVNMIRLADKSKTDSTGVNIIAKDNLDAASQYALNQGHGKELKSKLLEYRQLLIEMAQDNPAKQQMYRNMFPLDDEGGGRGWEVRMFETMPLSAAVTLLTKYQSDVRAAEVDMVEYLKNQTDALDYRVNKMEALVVPDSRYVVQGGNYSAKIVLSAVDSTARPVYIIGNDTLDETGLYQVSAGRVGTFTYDGKILLQGNDGEYNEYPFTSDYTVGEPSATISNEDLKVVYQGIDNKFSVSVPGFSNNEIDVRAVGATVVKRGNLYVINPNKNQDKEITINVYARLDNGRTSLMKTDKFRVKQIPDPKSFVQYRDAGGVIRQRQEGRLTKAMLRASDFEVIASYGPDELIQAQFNVVSFTMSTPFGAVDAVGSKLTKRQLDEIDRLERGDFILFRNIKAVGPDGKTRSLSPIQVDI